MTTSPLADALHSAQLASSTYNTLTDERLTPPSAPSWDALAGDLDGAASDLEQAGCWSSGVIRRLRSRADDCRHRAQRQRSRAFALLCADLAAMRDFVPSECVPVASEVLQ
jgi:hypothetical protein